MPRTKDRGTERAVWHEALLEANRMVTEKNLGRQDFFLNRVEDLLDTACLGVRDLVAERDALREALEEAADWLDNDLAHAPDTPVSMADRELIAHWRSVLDRTCPE